MICDMVSLGCEDVIRRTKVLLNNRGIRCLVVIDGLDEWVPPEGHSGLPDTYGLVNTVLFFTSRPWKISKLHLRNHSNDRVVNISGLLPKSEDKVIEYVLVNVYGLTPGTNLFRDKLKKYSAMAKDSSLKSLTKIPMMLTALCYMWIEEDAIMEKRSKKDHSDKIIPSTQTSMAYTYLSLVEAMIRRADEKHDLCTLVKDMSLHLPTKTPTILSDFIEIAKFINALLPFCSLAYADLVSSETKLVFPKEQLEEKIGHSLVQLALKVGLISQAKAPGRFHQQNVSINFYHKTIQEFMAALHIACSNTEAMSSFCDHLSSVSLIMQQANIIMFVMGLFPSVGSKISKHVSEIMNNDVTVNDYRQTMCGSNCIENLYRMQCNWYGEIQNCNSWTAVAKSHPIVTITDIYLRKNSESDAIKITEALMYGNRNNIASLNVFGYFHAEYSLINILQYLQVCPRLSTLAIFLWNKDDHDMLATVLPHLTQLRTIQYVSNPMLNHSDVANAIHAIEHLNQLRYVNMHNVYLADNVGMRFDHMVQLRLVNVFDLNMSAGNWTRFMLGLLDIGNNVHVMLKMTNIDDRTVSMIQTNPCFKLTRNDGKDERGKYKRVDLFTVPSQDRQS